LTWLTITFAFRRPQNILAIALPDRLIADYADPPILISVFVLIRGKHSVRCAIICVNLR
jgi:hypothetical protein